VIWTTTPWTIPSNQALNVHPEVTYALVSDRPQRQPVLLILAQDLVESVLQRYKLEGDVVATTTGEKLGGLRFKHPLHAADPFYDRTSPVYLADYVTTDSGTGVVHSAPGLRPGRLPVLQGARHEGRRDPETRDGRRPLREHVPLFGGMTIWEASKPICNALSEAGALFELKMFDHSYMHCWRHKTPIVYRATSQWFAGMDVKPKDGGATLRESALAGIADTQFFPTGARRACTA
jgi:isoleucyl-tRNA synthetase